MAISILDQVHAANEAYYRAFTDLDLDATMALWSRRDDAFCTGPIGPVAFGFTAVRDLYAHHYAQLAGVAFRYTLVGVGFDDPVATLICEEQVTHDEQVNDFLATNLFRLEDGGWRMFHHHASWRSTAERRPLGAGPPG